MMSLPHHTPVMSPPHHTNVAPSWRAHARAVLCQRPRPSGDPAHVPGSELRAGRRACAGTTRRLDEPAKGKTRKKGKRKNMMAKVMNTESAPHGETSLTLISNVEAAFEAMKLQPIAEASTSTNEGGHKVRRRDKGKKGRNPTKPYG
uniref:Uncharacterized protein n=1 Tax=Oryza nivara TaxID=4536 RepID=A0A0E0HB96_ORYNI